MYIDSYKKHCYLVLADLMANCKEQVLITSIKTNMQCSICHVPLKEKELLIWL